MDSSTENLLQVPPLHSLEQAVSVPVTISNDLGAADNVQVYYYVLCEFGFSSARKIALSALDAVNDFTFLFFLYGISE